MAQSQRSVSDADNAFGGLEFLNDNASRRSVQPREGDGDKPKTKRVKLFRYDHAAVQGLQIDGTTPIESLPLKDLWAVVKGGGGQVAFHSNQKNFSAKWRLQ